MSIRYRKWQRIGVHNEWTMYPIFGIIGVTVEDIKSVYLY
jgi:hypothetical protein